MEPISPELVLVDPELAGVENGRVPENARPRTLAVTAALRCVPEQMPLTELIMEAPPARRGSRDVVARLAGHVALTLLFISLMANGVLTAVVLSAGLNEQPSPTLPTTRPPSSIPVVPNARGDSSGTPAAPSRPAGVSTAASPQSRPRPKGRRTPRATVLGETSAMVERKILALIVQSPAGKLPPVLIDRRTGLAKNNLQAVCRLSQTSSFLCVVRPARHKPKEGLYVRYRPARNGRGVFTWYRYRSG